MLLQQGQIKNRGDTVPIALQAIIGEICKVITQ